MIEIPEREHKVADQWHALSEVEATALNKCLLRTVDVVVRGKTNHIGLLPSLAFDNGHSQNSPYANMPYMGLSLHSQTDWLPEALHGRKPDTIVRSFLLNDVARDANVLLNTSDLSRVQLTRGSVKMMFDLTSNPRPDIWLENGDLIEIPEIGAPSAEPK
jgi:hypothetical protein